MTDTATLAYGTDSASPPAQSDFSHPSLGGFASGNPSHADATITDLTVAPPRPKLTRADILAIRKRENELGIAYELLKTGITARIRDLSFTDRTFLTGIPASLRAGINAALADNNANQRKEGESLTIEQALRAATNDQAIADAICVAVFLWPRLVATEADLDGSDDCWVVTDLHSEERRAVMNFVMRSDRGDVARLATFPDSGVAGA